jgi:methyltransferase (TIGR00027 family)
MKADQPSSTAYRVAMRRAAHQLLDDPKVLDDPIALRIVGPRAEAAIRSDPRRYQSRLGRVLRAFLAARSRCAEDALRVSVAAGVRQYVILGAGLDTFAYRNPYAAQGLRVFEVDHPATQGWKRSLLGQVGIEEPDSVTYVPVDFETQSLPERLSACGFDPHAPAFFSWLGVVMYLTRDTVMSTLGFVANRSAGSGITFDYLVPPSSMHIPGRIAFWLMSRRVAKAGEPWRTWFDPATLARDMRELGFARLEDLDGPALDVRYFGGRARELQGRSAGHVMTATR